MELCCLHDVSRYVVYLPPPFGCAPAWFYMSNQARVTRVLVDYSFGLPSWAFSILGRARYTNNGYPKGIPMIVAPECLGKSKTCVETPIIIISEVEEIQGETIDPEIYQVNVVDHV